MDVAVKEINLSGNESAAVNILQTEPLLVQSALAEVNTMAHLPKHVNLCQYFGSYLRSADAATACELGGLSTVALHLVLEFCGGGTLYAALHAGPRIDILQRTQIITGVAQGLAAIHEHRPAILHQDLSTNNILLTVDGTPKLADFGLARLRACSDSFRTQHVRGTPHYMAPEVWDGNHLTEKVDVYAFAMVMLEVWTVEIPWAGYRIQEIGGRVARGERPNAASRLPASYGQLASRCWASLPGTRPTARQVVTKLEQRQKALCALASYGATRFTDVSTSVLTTLLQTLGHTADSARPSQVQRAASIALRLEGLCDYE
jgi:serine/threonine protein kinase